MAEENTEEELPSEEREVLALPASDDADSKVDAALENQRQTQEEVEDYLKNEQPGDTIDDKAKRVGWVPKEEFNGDPSKFKDASSYLDMVSSSKAATRRTLQKKDEQLENLKSQVFELATQMQKSQSIQVENQLVGLIKNLEDAHDVGDTKEAIRLDRIIRDLELQKGMTPKQNIDVPDVPDKLPPSPVVISFKRDRNIGSIVFGRYPEVMQNQAALAAANAKYLEIVRNYGSDLSDNEYANAVSIELSNMGYVPTAAAPATQQPTGYNPVSTNLPQQRSTMGNKQVSFESLSREDRSGYEEYRNGMEAIDHKPMSKQDWAEQVIAHG